MSHEVVVAGETLIDFLPKRPGPLTSVEGFDRRPGGAPANVAVALTRLESTPLFWTRVGDDPFGRYLATTLEEHGLPADSIERDPEAKTTLAFVTHDEIGDRSFSFYRENTADTRFESGTVDDRTLASAEWVHVGGVALSSGSSREAMCDLVDRASDHGCTVSFDPNARRELWPDEETFRRVTRDVLTDVDVLKATREELELLGFDGSSGDHVAHNALEVGPHTVLLTRGSDGAVAVTAPEAPWSGTAIHPGYEIDVVDTTGAGDAFVAGAIVGLNGGRGLEETLEFANAVAATTTTATGAMTALPDLEAVDSIVGRN
ncbi:carbohydrate kinase [Halostagnicola sp. A-GB9-2]|uniref:carbohydrate kinase family protein n=1 Tax=Halostagnicola sp. A-GB9-2 TaxID=3048066 RepID=UPI0024BFA443|nr:carbohydrate kinase [Halostagnicola sp. A-GB9-2]MDJ1433607.1 carbohydrate kinase [Halostagnicola sp. A-GB9-2]